MIDMIVLVITIGLFLIPTIFNLGGVFPFNFLIYIFAAMGIIFLLMDIHTSLDESINFKYKIVKKDGKYHAKVLRSWFFLIILWRPVKFSSSSGDYENFFGGKSFYYFTWEKKFSTEKEARDAIEKYKRSAKIQIKEYFERKTVTTQKIKI